MVPETLFSLSTTVLERPPFYAPTAARQSQLTSKQANDSKTVKQETSHKVGQGETPHRFFLKRCRYSSLEKFEDAFDTALDLMILCTIINANKAVGCGNFGRFTNLDKCRPKATGDVISGMAVDHLGTDVRASFGEYKLNSGRIIRLFGRTRFAHFCAVFNKILQQTRSSQ